MILGLRSAGLRHRECEPEGEVRGRPQEGDQEAAALQGPDQDLDPVQRDQGQEGDPPRFTSLCSMFVAWMDGTARAAASFLPENYLLPRSSLQSTV